MATSWSWATVTELSPLLVQLDGDSAPLIATPDTLLDTAYLSVGSRVRCELTDRRLIVHGVAGGTPYAPPTTDTDWVNITSGFASGFVTGTTGGPLQYRIRNGVCYWRGGVDGTMPTATYTIVVTGLPVETRHSFVMPIRAGAGFSGAVGGFAEMHSAGTLKFAQASGANKVWGAFSMSYPLDPLN